MIYFFLGFWIWMGLATWYQVVEETGRPLSLADMGMLLPTVFGGPISWVVYRFEKE